MAKSQIDEGVIKYVIKFFFRGIEKQILKDPEVKQALRNISKHAAEINESLDRLEKITGKDFSDLRLKHK